MKHICLFILSFSGALCVGLCKAREYILIKQMKTWTEAQSYCRINHEDLATVQTAEDQINLKQTADESHFTLNAWIGLYNDINSWRWSYQDQSLIFTNWGSGQPNNYGSGEECVVLRYDGSWEDYYCTNTKYFLCFNDKNATVKYYLINQAMTWSDAQKYCRKKHVDLVTIRNQAENYLLKNMIYGLDEIWIGLFRDDWKWTDKSNLSSINEQAVQHLNGANEDCATSDSYSYIEDRFCSTSLNFYCTTVKFKRQIVRVQLKSNVDNMNDVQLKTLVSQKLQKAGLSGDDDVTVTWRKQLNGHFFQKLKNVPESDNSSSLCYDQSF